MDAVLNFDQLQTPVWIYDTINYRIHWANQSAISLWQADSLTELVCRDFRTDASDAVQHTLLSYLDEFAKGHTISHWWRLNPKGHTTHVFCRFSGVRLDDGRMAMLVEGLEQNEQLISGVSGSALLSLCDTNGDIISSNPALRECCGSDLKHLSDFLRYPEQCRILLQIASEQGYHQEDIKIRTLKGVFWHSLELRRICRDDMITISLTLQDIHGRKSRELEHQAMALLDPLTDALNRTGLMERVEPLIQQQVALSLYYVDLDGFKPINDSYGHATGDELLKCVATRLIGLVGEQGYVARIGGDEFVVVIPRERLANTDKSFAEQLLQAVSGQYQVKATALSIALSASVGVSRFPEHDNCLSLLLANADAAMYQAKSSGRRRCVEYSPGMREQFHRHTRIAQLLSNAISCDQLALEYQPVIDTRNNTIVLMEALLRWRESNIDHISPEELIEAAEQCGLIGELSRWIYLRACSDFASMKGSLDEGVKLSVNVSALHIMQGGFIDSLNSALLESGLSPTDLILELTEKVMLPGNAEHESLLPELIKQGFSIAIDDFGTGFSSLAYLHSIPAEWVKLDREFVNQLQQGSETILAIQQLVNRLGMKMIVEGIETKLQLQQLNEAGVHLMQGFQLARPLTPEKLCRDWNHRSAGQNLEKV